MGLFNNTAFRIMEQGLFYTAENKKVISHNITNIDTPGYKSKYLGFEGILREKMDQKQKYKYELHLKQSDIFVDEITKGQPDGNNVDYEVQSLLLVRNALQQEAIINQIESEFRMMKSVMRKS